MGSAAETELSNAVLYGVIGSLLDKGDYDGADWVEKCCKEEVRRCLSDASFSQLKHLVKQLRMTSEAVTMEVDADSLKTLEADTGAEKLSKVTHIKCTFFEADGAALLSAVIPKCTNLMHLDLNGNNIGPEGASSLCAALKGNTSITKVRADFVLFLPCDVCFVIFCQFFLFPLI